MKYLALLSSLGLLSLGLCAPAAAQTNWVTNGDFSRGLTGWTAGGVGVSPQIETYDVTGLGASQCFGINAGYPLGSTNGPYILSQTVLVVPLAYEVYVDVVCETISFNADGGTVWIKVGGVEVARHAYGRVSAQTKLRDIVCARFTPRTGGQLKLEVGMTRGFAALRGRTPRLRIDNIGMRFCPGPAFCMRGSRRPGDTVMLAASGTPNAAFAVFVGTRVVAGIPVPPLSGTLRLDPTALVPFWTGRLDAAGDRSRAFRLPTTVLPGVSLYFQAAEVVSPTRGGFGIHHDYGLQR